MKECGPFLDTLFSNISEEEIDVSGFTLDHIAYQASSAQNYDDLKPQFLELGREVHEELVHRRRVDVFKLPQPITYKKYSFYTLELLEPKPDQNLESQWDHVEFIIGETFEEFMEQYEDVEWDTRALDGTEFAALKVHFEDGLTVKFVHHPILEIVPREGIEPSRA